MINKKFALLLGIMLMFSFVFVSAKEIIDTGIIGDGKIDIDKIDTKVELCYDNKFEFKVCDSKNLIDTKIKQEEVVLIKLDGVYLKDKLTSVETKIKENKDSTVYIHKKAKGEVYHVDNANDVPVETELEFYYTKRPNVITHIDKNGNKVKDFMSWEYSWTPASCTGSGEEQVCSTDGYARLTTTLTENSIGSETFPLTFSPVQWKTDNQGYASFDGVDDYVNLGNQSSKTQVSFSSWIKANYVDDSSLGIYGPINGGGQNRFNIIYGGNSSSSTLYNILIQYRNDTSTTKSVRINNVPMNSWQYFTAVYNSQNWSFFLNGNLVIVATDSAQNIVFDERVYTLGFDNWNPEPSYLNGSLDNVQIYNRSLSPAEITTLYNNNRSKGVCDLITSGQVACYDFDDNSFGDGSGNGNYGTPRGFSSTTPEVNDIRTLQSSDYSLTNSGLFTILNEDYRYNLLILDWNYFVTQSYKLCTEINSEIGDVYGLSLMALISFLVVGATIIGLLWFIRQLKPLFSEKEGLGNLTL